MKPHLDLCASFFFSVGLSQFIMEEPSQQPERHKPTTSQGSWQESLREVGPYLSLGTQMVMTMVLFVGVGYFLDQRFETTPWLLLASTLLGMGTVFLLLIRVVRHLSKDTSSSKASNTSDADRPSSS